MAGILGVDPGPFTLAELITAVEGKRREAWDHTAELLAITAEINRDRKKRRRPFASEDFHPLRDRKKRKRKRRANSGDIPLNADTVGIIAELVVGRPAPS